jgi:hypothetical protein
MRGDGDFNIRTGIKNLAAIAVYLVEWRSASFAHPRPPRRRGGASLVTLCLE